MKDRLRLFWTAQKNELLVKMKLRPQLILGSAASVIAVALAYIALTKGVMKSESDVALLSQNITALFVILTIIVGAAIVLSHFQAKSAGRKISAPLWALIANLLLIAFFYTSVLTGNNISIIAGGKDASSPRQLAGPLDAWGKDNEREFVISASRCAAVNLKLLLLESHDVSPPIISVSVNGDEVDRITTPPGGGSQSHEWTIKGQKSEHAIFIPSKYLTSNNNNIVLKSVEGSWVAIDRVEILQYESLWKVWRYIVTPWSYILFWAALLLFIIHLAFLVAGQPSGKRRLAMYVLMWCMVGAFVAFSLVCIATYIELTSSWTAYTGEYRRPYKSFFRHTYVMDRELGWRLRPNYTVFTRQSPAGPTSVFYATNKHGYRSLKQETDFPKKGRAMLLGDSFLHGFLLNQDETISARMSRILGEYVYNFGISAYSTDQEYTTLLRWSDKIDVEWVVTLFYANDLTFTEKKIGHKYPKSYYEIVDGQVDFSRLHKLPEEKVKSWNDNHLGARPTEVTYCCFKARNALTWKRIVDKSFQYIVDSFYPPRLFNRITNDIKIAKAVPATRYLDVTADLLEKPEELTQQFETVFQFFRKMKEVTESKKRKFLVVYIPDMREVIDMENSKISNLRRRFFDYCEKNQIECHNPIEDIVAKSKLSNIYFLDDGHFSPYGAHIMAESIAGRIIDR